MYKVSKNTKIITIFLQKVGSLLLKFTMHFLLILFDENQGTLFSVPVCNNTGQVSNGFCNDEANIADCNYDGGDCCVNVNTDYCSECNCLGNGVITSPGFPGNYYNNLNLTWLIQVQSGQLIQTHFVHFDIEYGPWNPGPADCL